MVVAVNDRKGQIVAIQLTYVTQTGRKSPHNVNATDLPGAE